MLGLARPPVASSSETSLKKAYGQKRGWMLTTFLHVSYKRSGANRGQTLRKVSGGYQRLTAYGLKSLREAPNGKQSTKLKEDEL